MLFIILLVYLLPLIRSFNSPIPISFSNLNKKKIHKFTIDNIDYALWWDNNKWSATENVCKHRQGSLYNGVITKDGNITD